MKMSDLQYTKFSFGGQKMRILGKVSITVQTIHEGLASGNFHMKANVVLDLFKNFEIESIAGVKIKKQLEGSNSNCTYSGALSTGSSTPSTPRSSPPPSPRAATPPRARTPSPPPAPAPRSPPGFPAQPQHRDSVPTPRQPRTLPYLKKDKKAEIKVSMITTLADSTIRGRNLNSLEDTFCNADIMPDTNKELRALHEADPNGRVTVNEDRIMTFTTTSGLRYEMGHGRNRCHPAMCQDRNRDEMPNNCGYLVGQWLIPYGFQPCGPNCRAAYCVCINHY